eukprot:m.877668 g.877668  ORF g.877668 m.877668 type:complete len:82 (+) comp23582_c0_seq5:4708-4953(+)
MSVRTTITTLCGPIHHAKYVRHPPVDQMLSGETNDSPPPNNPYQLLRASSSVGHGAASLRQVSASGWACIDPRVQDRWTCA